MAAPQNEAAGAHAQATGRDLKPSPSLNFHHNAVRNRAIAWAAIGVALFITLGADDIRPAGGSMSARWGDAAGSAR